jgi:hypothetical protein
MALTRVDLSGSICVEDACSKLIFNDDTGFLVSECADDQNDLGYGLAGGIALNDVTEAILNVYYPSLTTPFKFTFAITNHVITECILTDLNGNDTDITADLESTVFPLTDFQVNLEAYSVTFPELTDGIIEWDYTISGVSGGLSFSYTTSSGGLSDCDVNCCIENKYLELLTDCGCSDDKIETIKMAEIFANAARLAVNVGQDSKADGFITKANEICNNNCKDC